MPPDSGHNDIHIEHRLEFLNLPQHWEAVLMLLVGALLCFYIIWIYRLERRQGSTQTQRRVLAVVRCCVMIFLMLMWLEPVWARYVVTHIESRTLVLIDASASMGMQDFYQTPEDQERLMGLRTSLGVDLDTRQPVSRGELAEHILRAKNQQWLRAFAAKNAVSVYSFGDVPRKLAELDAERSGAVLTGADITLSPTDPVTDLGRAVRRVLDEAGEAPVAALVLLGDGGFNSGESIEVLAELLRRRRIPVHAIGLGSLAEPANVRIVDFHVPENVFVNDPFPIKASLQATALAGVPIQIKLKQYDALKVETAVFERAWTPESPKQLQSVEFLCQSDSPGRCIYRLEVSTEGDESTLSDNSDSASVEILSNKLEALLIAGGPSWTYRYVSRLLQREATVDVSCWLQSAQPDAFREGNTVITRLPDGEELSRYDAFLLIDPDATGLSRAWCDQLQEHVAKSGAGMIYVASRKFAPEFFVSERSKPLVAILPIVPEPDAGLILNQLGHYQRQGHPVEFSKESGSVSLWENTTAQQNLGSDGVDLWGRMTRVYWHYPVKHEKPAATVLMRHGHPRMQNSYGGHVLFALQYAGAGQAAFMAFDDTWRWRRYSQELFNQFWIRLLRRVAHARLSAGSTGGQIEITADRFVVGSEFTFDIRLPSAVSGSNESDPLTLSLERLPPDGIVEQVKVQPHPTQAGTYQGRWTANHRGAYLARVVLDGAEAQSAVTREFQVKDSDREFQNQRLEGDRIKQLVQSSSGGDYYELQNIMEIPAQISDCHQTRVSRVSPVLVWDRYWVLILLITLLGCEWGLRRRWHML